MHVAWFQDSIVLNKSRTCQDISICVKQRSRSSNQHADITSREIVPDEIKSASVVDETVMAFNSKRSNVTTFSRHRHVNNRIEKKQYSLYVTMLNENIEMFTRYTTFSRLKDIKAKYYLRITEV